jgi:hypothetical protein
MREDARHLTTTIAFLANTELEDTRLFFHSCNAFTSSKNAHPIGDDQKRLGGENVWPAAPLKVAIALVVVLVQACGWPSEIWLTGQTVGFVMLEGAVETVVELKVVVELAEELLEEDEGVVCVVDVVESSEVVVMEGVVGVKDRSVEDDAAVLTVSGAGPTFLWASQ